MFASWYHVNPLIDEIWTIGQLTVTSYDKGKSVFFNDPDNQKRYGPDLDITSILQKGTNTIHAVIYNNGPVVGYSYLYLIQTNEPTLPILIPHDLAQRIYDKKIEWDLIDVVVPASFTALTCVAEIPSAGLATIALGGNVFWLGFEWGRFLVKWDDP